METMIRRKLAQYASRKQELLAILEWAPEESFLYARANFGLAWLELKTAVLRIFAND